MTREWILSEIRRTAEANGGKPLGRSRFFEETGIRENDWIGRYWTRWSDAVREAGYHPNSLNPRFEDTRILEAIVPLVRRLQRMPTVAEYKMARRDDRDFPSHNTIMRLGRREDLIRRLFDHCEEAPDRQDVAALLASLMSSRSEEGGSAQPAAPPTEGYVYLLKSGRYYKIGLTFDMDRRVRDLRIQLPERVEEIHRIATDDPQGIERYWHQRFGERRANGEWFELTAQDVSAFKRRRFM